MPGQSWLGDLQVRRRSGDAAELRDPDEVVQAAQLHDSAISRADGGHVNPIS
jgi:hypothetical protein